MIEKNCLRPKNINGKIISCGKCINCIMKKRAEWSIRGTNELDKNKDAIMITLTYNNENLPKKAYKKETENDCLGSLRHEDLCKFWKRLRKKFSKNKIKYIACGEYGGQDLKKELNNEEEKKGTWRPHYHAIVWGLPKNITENELKELWKFGFLTLDYKDVIRNHINYIIGYITKKMTDENAQKYYEKNNREKPFIRVSKGIGLDWMEKNEKELIEYGVIFTPNGEKSIPRYYLKKIYESEGKKIKLVNKRIIATELPNGTFIYKEKKTINYKLFLNPYGKKTSKIQKKILENKIEAIKKDKDLKENEKNEIIKQKIEEYNEKLYKDVKNWEYINNHTENEIKQKYQTEKIIINNKRNNSYEGKFRNYLLDEETQEKLESKARAKEYFFNTVKKNKKRNKIEKDEIIKIFVFGKKEKNIKL